MIIFKYKKAASELLREVREYYLQKEGKEIKLDDLEYLTLEFLISVIVKNKSHSEIVTDIAKLYKSNPLALEIALRYEVEILQMKRTSTN